MVHCTAASRNRKMKIVTAIDTARPVRCGAVDGPRHRMVVGARRTRIVARTWAVPDRAKSGPRLPRSAPKVRTEDTHLRGGGSAHA